MKRILILLASLLVVGNVYALPECPRGGYKDNCFGQIIQQYEHSRYGWYKGEFKNNRKHGQGTIRWNPQMNPTNDDRWTGDKYVGQWKDDRRHGKGTYISHDGKIDAGKYVGDFKNGDLIYGIFSSSRSGGGTFVGEFRDFSIYNGIVYDSSGKLVATFSYGDVWCSGECVPTQSQLVIAQQARSIAEDIELNRKLASTGTGFVVSKRYIVTAEHVVDGCSLVSVVLGRNKIQAQTVSKDKDNDLALLKFNSSSNQTALLRRSNLRMGESAINFGYPRVGVLSSNPQITAGYVSALAGYKNNSAFFQYSAPTQFGNSGGPVLDASGNVIGVVSAKLDDADNQLVNFATKSTILEGFLKANKVPFEKADLGDKLELPDIAEKAETFTVLVGCWE